jgi:hypothetical protein
MKASKLKLKRDGWVRSSALLVELRDALTHTVNADRSLRENRLLHTDNNIRAIHRCLVAALAMVDSPNDRTERLPAKKL